METTVNPNIRGPVLFRAGYLGNPYFYGNFKDEGANHVIKGVADNAHSRDFELRIMAAFTELATRARQRVRKRKTKKQTRRSHTWVFDIIHRRETAILRPEIVDFGGLGGPGRPGYLLKRRGA